MEQKVITWYENLSRFYTDYLLKTVKNLHPEVAVQSLNSAEDSTGVWDAFNRSYEVSSNLQIEH